MKPVLPPITWNISCAQPGILKADWPAIVNRIVNRSIETLPGSPEVTAAGRYWPVSGWCIDFAWTKREELLLRGYHAGELVLCECQVADGEHHMVLFVGGMVLDSIIQHLYPISEMRYRIVRQQTTTDPNSWEAP